MLIRSALIQQDSHSLTINEDIINRDMPHTGRLIFLTQPERRPTKRTGFNSERTCLHLHRKNFYEPLNSDVWLNTNEFQLPVERYIFALVSVTVCVHCVCVCTLNTNELQATIANLAPYFSRAILLNEPSSAEDSVRTNIWVWGKLWPSTKKSIICHHQVHPKRGLRNKTAQLWNFVFYQTSLSRSLLCLWMELARYTVPHIRTEIPASFPPRFSITECAGTDWRHLKRESTQYLLVLHRIELCSNRSSPLIISVTNTC